MKNEDRWEAAISRLAEQTTTGEIAWKAVPEVKGRCTSGENVIGLPYRATVKERIFFIYQYEYRYYHDENEWSPASDVAIEIVNGTFELEFALPQVPSRWRLLEAVRERASGASDFLDEFLTD